MAVNPVQVEKYLKGIDYPISKADLINIAKEQGADDNITSTLGQLPDKVFESPIDISQAIGKIE